MLAGEWSDRKAWLVKLVTTLVTFIVISVIGFLAIDPLQYKIERVRIHEQAVYDLRFAAYQEFSSASYEWISVVYDAYSDAQDGMTRRNSDAIQKYQDDLDIEMDFALDSLTLQFEGEESRIELAKKIKEFKAIEESLHSIIKREIESTPNENDAKEFTNKRTELKVLRHELLRLIESIIAPN